MTPFFFISLCNLLYMVVAIVMPESNPISNYNGYIIGAYFFICFLFLKKNVHFLPLVVLSGIYFFLISDSWMYPLLDTMQVSITVGLLLIASRNQMRNQEISRLLKVLLLFFIANAVLIFWPPMYQSFAGEFRYIGIFKSCNFSVSTMAMIGIVIWEIEKKSNEKITQKWILLLNIIGILALLIATRTRSVLFVLPYWVWQCYHFYNRKVFIGLIFATCVFFAQSIYLEVMERLNLQGDDSSRTRGELYMAYINGIKDYFFVLPHGSNAANFFAKSFYSNDEFTAHNDFLRYLYDWGVFFYFYLCQIYRFLKRSMCINWEFLFILLALASCSLHNMMLLPYIWIPFATIVNIRTIHSNR